MIRNFKTLYIFLTKPHCLTDWRCAVNRKSDRFNLSYARWRNCSYIYRFVSVNTESSYYFNGCYTTLARDNIVRPLHRLPYICIRIKMLTAAKVRSQEQRLNRDDNSLIATETIPQHAASNSIKYTVSCPKIMHNRKGIHHL